LYYSQPDDDQLLPLTDDLRSEIDGLATSLGHRDFDAWVGCENFENRTWPDKVDPQVLAILRRQAAAAC